MSTLENAAPDHFGRSEQIVEIGALLGKMYRPEQSIAWLFIAGAAFDGAAAAALILNGKQNKVLAHLRALIARIG